MSLRDQVRWSMFFRWPADKSDGLGTTSRIKQARFCDINADAVSSINISAPNAVKNYFHTPMMDCINQIPENRRSRTLIFLGRLTEDLR